MIIESLLDVDLYKLTMAQVAFFKHRDTIIGSSIIPLCGTGLKKD
jgi:nicotinic acid phosphoribosyltransferase